MFIVCDANNVIVEYDDTMIYADNGYPYLPNKDIMFVPSGVNVYEVASTDTIEVAKFCYTEADGFYPNPNYREPSAYDLAPQDVVDAIIDEYTNELIEMGVL